MGYNPFETVEEDVKLAPVVADEIKKTTCYMCACRCGIRVYLKDGEVRYIDGNPDHPINKGVLCAKGSAGIMQQNSPAKLKKPLLRVGERGEGKFKEIEWEEALRLATQWLSSARNEDPRKVAFFTGRDQSQSFTGWWATQFGTPNFAAHGGFCSVNMAAAGLYTIGGAFWEFGEPDWDLTKYFMMFGVAEDHDSNPIKNGIGRMKTKGEAKFVSINPVRTGYSAVADEWVGVKPGTDGMLIGAFIHELLHAGKIDANHLAKYTNAPFLIIQANGDADDGLIARDEKGNPLILSANDQSVQAWNKDTKPSLMGEATLPDGRMAKTALSLLAERFMDDAYSPEKAADICGVSATVIKRLAAEMAEAAFETEVVIDQPWTDAWGRQHDKMIGRPIAFHAMRGISAHSNGFHTCRMLHILQMLLGAIDTPGSWRYKPPFPRPLPPAPVPHANSAPNSPLDGPPIGNPKGPENLMVEADGTPKRIDKAFSWENPLSIHGMMHMVLHNAWRGDPYEIDVLFMFMANMAWNSSMNVPDTLKYLTDKDPKTGQYKIKHFIYVDAFQSETVSYADLILPDTTYLERWDALSILDRPISEAKGPCDSIRQPVLKPDRDVRPFQSVLLDLGARLGLPGMVNEDYSPKFPGGYEDYLVNHERAPGVGPLAGWRGKDGSKKGKGEPNPNQLEEYVKNGCFWHDELPMEKQYFKYANQGYLDYAAEMGLIPEAAPIMHHLYDETLQKFNLAAQGHGNIQPPDHMRDRVKTYCDPMPKWYPPFEGQQVEDDKFPMFALTQRPMHMYHSWGSQNAWLRQITARNVLFMNTEKGAELGIDDLDWAWVESHHGRIKVQVKLMEGTEKDTVWTWNAIGKRRGAWGLNDKAPEARKGFLMNHLISDLLPQKEGGYHYSNSDPITGQASWFDLKVRVEKCQPHEFGETEPLLPPVITNPAKGPTQTLAFGKGMEGEDTDKVSDTIIERVSHRTVQPLNKTQGEDK